MTLPSLRATIAMLILLALIGPASWFIGRALADAAADGDLLASDRLETVGVWSTHASLGAAEGDPILRAWVARTAILPLAGGEVAYFWTTRTTTGAALNPDCAYEVTVPQPDARWWSISTYDDRYRPIANAIERYSVNSRAGVSRFTVSRTPPDDQTAWLPLGEAVSFELFFRVYQPGPGFDARAETSMPAVREIGPC
ncbi:MAG: DUF1214 domain-containing protein [Pseudomonadota bacterium]